jgi:hypothetical protein
MTVTINKMSAGKGYEYLDGGVAAAYWYGELAPGSG